MMSLSTEHKRRISYAKIRWWAEMTPEKRAEHIRKMKAGRTPKPKITEFIDIGWCEVKVFKGMNNKKVSPYKL